MGKIVAIGGGHIGSPGQPVETTEIDKETIRLSGSREPRLLFIPTATDDSESYVETVHRHFGQTLGCTVDTLHLIKERPSVTEIQGKVFSANIIYVGGGNTLKMLRIWRRLGVTEVLLEAYQRNIVLSGVSAGAICWFKYGSSDSRRFATPHAGLIKIRGLDLVNALYCPHYDTEEDRRPHLRELMEKTSGVALAVDSCCAIEILNDKYRVIASKSRANAYKVYWSKGEFYEEIIEKADEFRSIENLLKK
ncbi:MAG TPA: peptidase E [Dehalococcoidales bacterium]|nr:peptidase E [Dehalococcoidales bacterium]